MGEKKSGGFSKLGSAIKQAAADRAATKDEASRQHAEAAENAGAMITSGVFGTATIEIYAGGYVRVAQARAEATQPAKVTARTPYEKLRSIKFTAAGAEQEPTAFEASTFVKGASTLMKGGSGLLKASAPGLAVAGLSQMAKAKLGKTFLTIATDRQIHTLTNETHNGWMKVSNKGHNDVGLVLEEAGNSVLGPRAGNEVAPSLDTANAPSAQPVPPALQAVGSTSEPSIGDRLRELAALRDDGIISDEDFAASKAKLLGL